MKTSMLLHGQKPHTSARIHPRASLFYGQTSLYFCLGDRPLALPMHGLHERFHKIRALLPTQPLPEVGDEPLRPERLQHIPDALPHRFPRVLAVVDEQTGIVISLESGAALHHVASGAAVRRSVQGDHVVVVGEGGVREAGAAGEGHDGHLRIGLLQFFRDAFHAGHGEFVEIGLVDHHAHRLEDLNELGSRLDLALQVLDDHGGQGVHQPQALLLMFRQPPHSDVVVLFGRSAHHVIQ
mmetsp:Transcript_19828/g.45026  ORF Transcript_19828/g.45026 Transcript_19828/m.45026 type:complete len:239 (+) Transcript_19828:125-841(+)